MSRPTRARGASGTSATSPTRTARAVAGAARALAAALGMASLLFAAAGCGEPGEEVCDAYCDCADCSERERDVCLAEQAAEADIASVYDCDAELEDYQSCVVAKADCPGGVFNADECNAEGQEYETCKD
jgi:hypothetical protein